MNRDRATGELFRIYDDALVGRNPPDLLFHEIQRFCQDVEVHEPERAAAARAHKEGRTEDLDARLKIAVDVAEKIKEPGSVEAAIRFVVGDQERYDTVRKNYYTGNGHPDWRRWVQVSLGMRRSRAEAKAEAEAAKAVSEQGAIPADHDPTE